MEEILQRLQLDGKTFARKLNHRRESQTFPGAGDALLRDPMVVMEGQVFYVLHARARRERRHLRTKLV